MACEVSTTRTRETDVSWQRSWSVRSVVDTEVKPFNSNCWSPEKLLHFSWLSSFSSLSLFSCLSSDTCPSSLFSSLRDIWYSNSKSDSINDTATQKMVANRLLGWLMLFGSVILSLDEDGLRVLDNKLCWSQAWIRSIVALRGGSDHLSACPNFLGTDELLWCLILSSLLRLSCPVLFLLDVSFRLMRISGDDALEYINVPGCQYNTFAEHSEFCSWRNTNLVKIAMRSLFFRHSAKLSTTDSSVSNTSIT